MVLGLGSDYMPSRIKLGCPILHILIVSMEYLIKRYHIRARYLISVHDELWHLVKEEDRYRAALVLQISDLWREEVLGRNTELSTPAHWKGTKSRNVWFIEPRLRRSGGSGFGEIKGLAQKVHGVKFEGGIGGRPGANGRKGKGSEKVPLGNGEGLE
jgi:hypothetical protein